MNKQDTKQALIEMSKYLQEVRQAKREQAQDEIRRSLIKTYGYAEPFQKRPGC